MYCPKCKHPDSKVTDSRTVANGSVVRRRRECEACNYRFTTFEKMESTQPMVVKKDGRREPFDRAKVLKGMKKACQKRPIATEELDKAAERLEEEILASEAKEISSTTIGEWVMSYLRKLDDVAYVRFASVYHSFRDVDEFLQELTGMVAAKKPTGTAKK